MADARRAYQRYLELQPHGEFAVELRAIVDRLESSDGCWSSGSRPPATRPPPLSSRTAGGSAPTSWRRRSWCTRRTAASFPRSPHASTSPPSSPSSSGTVADAGIGFGDLDAVAVTCGPGLVGALLVGVETAKALAFAPRQAAHRREPFGGGIWPPRLSLMGTPQGSPKPPAMGLPRRSRERAHAVATAGLGDAPATPPVSASRAAGLRRSHGDHPGRRAGEDVAARLHP